MSNIFMTIPAMWVTAGGSFLLNLDSTRPCTVLKNEAEARRLLFVQQDDEEIQILEGEDLNRSVYLLNDFKLKEKQESFRENLSYYNMGIWELLIRVRANSTWGYGIRAFLSNPTNGRFERLLAELSSQAKDNPEAMIKMVGEPLTKKLLAHVV